MRSTLAKTIPVVEMTTFDGQSVLYPLVYPDSTWLASGREDMLRRLEKGWKAALFERGRFLQAVRAEMPEELVERVVELSFPPARGGNAGVSSRQERYHLLVATLADGSCQAFVPALGLEVRAPNAEQLDDIVREHIRLDDLRARRGESVQAQLATQWFAEVALHRFVLHFNVPRPDEHQEDEQERMLPRVASHLSLPDHAIVGLDATRRTLRDNLEGRFSRSVLVLGPDNSSKTSLIATYGQDRQRRGLSPIWQTTAANLVQGLTGDGVGWQKNLVVLINELAKHDELLYVGHLTELFEVGQYEGNSISIGAALRDVLQRGRCLLLAEATEGELAKLELAHAGFAALFQELRLPTWAESQQCALVQAAVASRADEQGVALEAGAVEEVIWLQRRYSPYSGFPGRPIRFLESLVLQQKRRGTPLGRAEVLAAFAEETGIPLALLDVQQPLDFSAMQAFFRQRVFGQEAAVEQVCATLLALKTALAPAGKPVASLLFLGPTGVGKTEMAKAMAEFIFGDPARMLRFDMSEYADPAAVLRLTGDLAIGEGSGALVTRIRQQPFSLVLFDELEKADASFFDLLLQILGEGRLTGGKGEVANFCSTVIVLTSNIGAAAMHHRPMGLHTSGVDPAGVARQFEHAVQQHFRPELFNRLDHILPFLPLGKPQRRPILDRELARLRQREGLRQRSVQWDMAEAAMDQLDASVADERYGARQMQRTLQDQVVFPLARVLAQVPATRSLHLHLVPGGVGALRMKVSAGQVVAAAPLEAADQRAQARRQLQKILAGPVYLAELNQRHILEMKKEKLRHDAPKFWNLYGSAYTVRLKQEAQAEALLAAALAAEGQDLLASLAEPDTMPPSASQQSTWADDYARFKSSLLSLARPEANVACLGIYGPMAILEIQRDLYVELACLRGWTWRCRTVRVQDEQFRVEVWPLPQDGRHEPGVCVGYEFEFTGESVRYFLAGEGGVWRWLEDDKKTHECYQHLGPTPLEKLHTPKGVHRKSFLDGKPVTRVVKGYQLFATNDAWNCLYQATALLEVLQTRWLRLVDALLIGEAEQ